MKSVIRNAILALGLTAASTQVMAVDLYKVEMVVFANLSSDDGGEYWPELPAPDTLGSFSLTSFDGYPLQQFEQLPTGDLQLGGDAAALSRSGNYALLFHKGWLQRIDGPSSKRKVEIRASFDDYDLTGTLRVYKQRYLHAQPDLQLTSNRLVTTTYAGATTEQPDVSATYTATGIAETENPQPLMQMPATVNSWQLNQSRRMRSQETHYLDHPKFGVLLRIRPVQ